MQNIIQRFVDHKFIDEELVILGICGVNPTKIDESSVLDLRENLNLIINLCRFQEGFLDGDGAAAVENGFVDEARAASAKQAGNNP